MYLFSLKYVTHRNTVCLSLSVCAVEQERDLLQPRPYWKEFRFDLTPLPQGETVTAAEFRIYKTLTMGQRANRTLHISVYEIQRESRHRLPPVYIFCPWCWFMIFFFFFCKMLCYFVGKSLLFIFSFAY